MGRRHWRDGVGLKAVEHNCNLRTFSLLFDGAVAAPGRQRVYHSLPHSPSVSVLRQNSQRLLRQNLRPEGSL